jgi:hypothetical protein
MVKSLQLNLLSNPEGVIYLDAKVAHRAFELCVAKQYPDSSDIARLLVNLRCLCSPHGVGAIGAGLQPDGSHPSMDDPSILPCRQMLRGFPAAWEKVAATVPSNERKPGGERIFRLLGDFKLDGPLRFLLNDGGAVSDRATRPQVLDPKLNEIASAELAVDGEIERASSLCAPLISSRKRVDLKRSLMTG